MSMSTAILLVAAAISTATDLGGLWTDTAATRPGPVRILDCYPNYTGYAFARAGGGKWQVRVRQVYHGGASLPWVHSESLTGELRGGRLRLGGMGGLVANQGYAVAPRDEGAPAPVAYMLTFEAATGHLVGVRNGKPLRLARVVLYKPAGGDCGPAPP